MTAARPSAGVSLDRPEASAGGRSLHLEADASLVVIVGETAERTLSFRRGAPLELRVLDESGARKSVAGSRRSATKATGRVSVVSQTSTRTESRASHRSRAAPFGSGSTATIGG